MCNPDMNMAYEMFLRQAFGVGRWGDPAQLANTDTFSSGTLAEIKVGAGYAMAIFNNRILENAASDERMNDFCTSALNNLLNASTRDDIFHIIEEYNHRTMNIRQEEA